MGGEMAACSRWKAVGSMSKLTRLGLMMFFFVRIGLPPLPRFFMKVEVILAVITPIAHSAQFSWGRGRGYAYIVFGASGGGVSLRAENTYALTLYPKSASLPLPYFPRRWAAPIT